MSNRLSTSEELAGFALGTFLSFVINAAVKKHLIAAGFDFLNLPILIMTAGVVGFQVFMKLKKRETSKRSNLVFAGLLGWFVGSWIVSHFISF